MVVVVVRIGIVKNGKSLAKDVKEIVKTIGENQKTMQKVRNNMSDQTIKADAGKSRLTLVPRKILFEIAKVREYGLKKYKDPENWKRVETERYRDAAFRHFMAYLDDPGSVDEESGLSHLSHLACNIAFLCEMEEKDERPDNNMGLS